MSEILKAIKEYRKEQCDIALILANGNKEEAMDILTAMF